jgi:hypothetical protein
LDQKVGIGLIRRDFPGLRGRNRADLPWFSPKTHRITDLLHQEVGVKAPRFRIAWAMLLVAIVGLNFRAIRAVMDHRGLTNDSLAVGVIPMANFLAVGLLIGHRRRESRGFLLGFEVFGATALALYIAMAILFDRELEQFYLGLAIKPLKATIGWTGWTTPRLLIAYFILSLWASLPQLAFALIGGFLTRRFRITEWPDRTRC